MDSEPMNPILAWIITILILLVMVAIPARAYWRVTSAVFWLAILGPGLLLILFL